jgi:hypothetical protein
LIAAATGPSAEQILTNITYQLERNQALADDEGRSRNNFLIQTSQPRALAEVSGSASWMPRARPAEAHVSSYTRG